jgi:hypothetical protein
VIDNDELAKIWHVNADGDMPGFACQLIDGRFRVHGGGEALAAAIERVRRECSAAVDAGARILILSDRDCDADHAPIPSLLLVSAVHQHLVRTGQRTKVGLVVETGEAREVHHVSLLVGYGAAAVNPYLAFESIEDLVASGAITGISAQDAIAKYVKALSKGVLKVMSKMASRSRCWTSTSATRRPASAASGWPSWRRRPRPATPPRTPWCRRPKHTGVWTSVASTSGGARASCTCSTPRRCSCCSTRPGSAGTRCSASTPRRSRS